MADQAITALPKKTYSGSSQIASTDYLLGIDSAEGYQMLIQDLGEYIINRATASLAGSTQTLASAISALNSKFGSALGSNPNFDNISEAGFYYFGDVTNAVNPPNKDAGYLNMLVLKVGDMVTQVVFGGRQLAQGGRDKIWVRYRNGNSNSDWNRWVTYATQSEVDALNSNTQLTITRTENNYADATSIGRLSARKRGNMLFLNFNLGLTSGTTSDFTEICRISGWDSVSDIYTNIPCQTNGSSVISVSITPSGIVKIYCGTGTITAGFYRAFFCIPCNS